MVEILARDSISRSHSKSTHKKARAEFSRAKAEGMNGCTYRGVMSLDGVLRATHNEWEM